MNYFPSHGYFNGFETSIRMSKTITANGKLRVRILVTIDHIFSQTPVMGRYVTSGRRSLTTSENREQTAAKPVAEIDAKVKCTLIPGDGVGPELCVATREVLSAMQVPIEFEELFLR